jgi:4'-phosphopantetheinyl transferase
MREDDWRLDVDVVHIWSPPLDQSQIALRWLERVLSAEEAARAERLVFATDRHRYVAAHGLLRLILAGYLGTGPEGVTLERDAGGKPRLAYPERLRFNLSHSGSRGLVAVSAEREVGIDIERIREMGDLEGLVQACFSPSEQAALAAVPASQRLRTFFAGWTRKEAFLKALGDGLARSLDSFSLPLAPVEPARLLRPPGAPGCYTLRALEPAPGYVGALVVAGPPVTVRWRDWEVLSAHWENTAGPRSLVEGGGAPPADR